MTVSFIVPALNASSSIGDTINSILAQRASEINLEILVVDNGSTDNTAEIARSSGARVISDVVKNRARARNIGARNAIGDILCFVDSDTTVGPDWLARAIFILAKFPGVGAWQSLVTFVDRVGNTHGSFLKDNFYFFSKLDSCAFAIRRQDFEKLGGFDEWLIRSEDTDLSCRLFLEGFDLFFDDRVEAKTSIRKRWAVRTFMENGFAFGQLLYRWRRILGVSVGQILKSHFVEWRALGDGKFASLTPHSVTQALISGIVSIGSFALFGVLKTPGLSDVRRGVRLGWENWDIGGEKYILGSELRCAYYPDSTRVVNLETRKVYSLAGFASELFREAASGNSGVTDSIVKLASEKYEIDLDELLIDLDSLKKSFLTSGILK